MTDPDYSSKTFTEPIYVSREHFHLITNIRNIIVKLKTSHNFL